jgi:LysR family glycine cleavage system transcriptional activator
VLTISTLTSLAVKWLLPRLSSFQEQHPEIDVRITTSMELVDFRTSNVDAAIRYGQGRWPGLDAEWLMAEHLFPVCSPKLLMGERALRRPEDLAHATLLHTSSTIDDWRLWLTAAGLPAHLSQNRGLTFDLAFMTIQAAIDGLGVAMGHTAYVSDDVASGRLVVPFNVSMPSAGYYFVTPQDRPVTSKMNLFRDWLKTVAIQQPA